MSPELPPELQVKNYKEISNRWRDRFEEAMDKYLSRSEIELDGVTDFIWEKGVLDHISPTDQEEFEARQRLDKDAFTRDNPELYWRIMYSAGNAKDSTLKNATLLAGYVAQVMIQVVMGLSIKNQNKFSELFPKDSNPIIVVADKIIEKAKGELIRLGIKPHEELIPIGFVGKFKGVNVKITRYTHDGLIALEADNYEDHVKLGELTNYKSAVLPQELDLSDFSMSPQ